MEKLNNQAQSAPGVDDATAEAVTVEGVKGYLKKDLSLALGCINAILSDEDLLENLAHFMHGRFQNHLHEKSRKPNV